MELIYKIFYLIAVIIKIILKLLGGIFGVAINAFGDAFSEVKCPKCGKMNKKDDKFCIQCGTSLTPVYTQTQSHSQAQQSKPIQTKKICSHCNYENEMDTKFCIKCGKSSFTTESTYREDETVAGYIVSLLAYIAKGDDVVSNKEAALIGKVLDELSLEDTHIRNMLKDIFNRAKDKSSRDHNVISQKLYKEILAEMDTMSERNDFLTMIAMYFMALVYVDGRLNQKQNTIVTEILKNLRFTEARIRDIHAEFQETQHADPKTTTDKDYATLNCKPSDSDETIKKAYRDLAKQYHPDTLQGKNLPEAIMILATEKFKEINAAYEKIKKQRGMK